MDMTRPAGSQKNPVIVSQIAGSRKTKPSKPRYDKDDAWDIGLIPKYWNGQAENASLSVAECGFKVASLWLTVACARVSDITHLCRDSMTFPLDQFGEVSGAQFQYWFTKEYQGQSAVSNWFRQDWQVDEGYYESSWGTGKILCRFFSDGFFKYVAG